jgi:hypothetical protein
MRIPRFFRSILGAACLSVVLAVPVQAGYSIVTYYPDSDAYGLTLPVVFAVTITCTSVLALKAPVPMGRGIVPVSPSLPSPCIPVVTRITSQGELPAWAVPYEVLPEKPMLDAPTTQDAPYAR